MTYFCISREKIESFFGPIFGIEVTEDGYLRDMETGEILTSPRGEELTIDEIGYFKPGDEQDVVPVKDTIPDIVEALSDRDFSVE